MSLCKACYSLCNVHVSITTNFLSLSAYYKQSCIQAYERIAEFIQEQHKEKLRQHDIQTDLPKKPVHVRWVNMEGKLYMTHDGIQDVMDAEVKAKL